MTMLRYNQGKVPLSLLPTSFTRGIIGRASSENLPVPTKLIREVGQVLDFGAQKYSAHNWRKGGSWSSVLNSALRHTVNIIDGRKIDAESGLPESGHLGCNIAFLTEFMELGIGVDDRYIVERVPLTPPEHCDHILQVYELLLDWQDGGGIENLYEAAFELAMLVETPDPTVH